MKRLKTILRGLLLVLILSSVLPGVRAESSENDRGAVVYTIPIHGQIEPALVYVIRRGVDAAMESDAKALIFLMDTPGGRLDATEKIIDSIVDAKIATYTYVEKDAFSAGAMIALSTQEIYMAPGSVIGDAMPIQVSPFGGVSETSEDVQEKMVSAACALVRSAAEQGGHDKQLAEAMVRREMEYKIGSETISPAGQLLTLTNLEAERRVGPENRALLSSGTVDNLGDLLEEIGLADAELKELKVSAAERIARYLAAISSLLLMVGLAGIYLEFKTPGLGLPGIAGAICLFLFFFGHHFAGLAGMEDMLVFVLGVVLLGVEVFLIPGFGVLGGCGLLLILLSLVNSMSIPAPGPGWSPFPPSLEAFRLAFQNLMVSLLGGGILAIAAGHFLPRSRFARPLVLSESEGFRNSSAAESAGLLGLEGVAYKTLRPSGSGLFGERRLDVVADAEYIEKGSPIRIIEVHGNRVIVERISP